MTKHIGILYINSGMCKCGCTWQQHHLGMICNAKAYAALPKDYPPYVPQECDHYGSNEVGGMKYNEETEQYEDHCHGYEDIKGPLGTYEWEN